MLTLSTTIVGKKQPEEQPFGEQSLEQYCSKLWDRLPYERAFEEQGFPLLKAGFPKEWSFEIDMLHFTSVFLGKPTVAQLKPYLLHMLKYHHYSQPEDGESAFYILIEIPKDPENITTVLKEIFQDPVSRNFLISDQEGDYELSISKLKPISEMIEHYKVDFHEIFEGIVQNWYQELSE